MAYACVCRFAYPWGHGWKLEVDVRYPLSLSTILFYLDVCIYEYVYAYVYIPVHFHEGPSGGGQVSSITYYFITLKQGPSLNLEFTISAKLAGQWAPRICTHFPHPSNAEVTIIYSAPTHRAISLVFHIVSIFWNRVSFTVPGSHCFWQDWLASKSLGSFCLYHYTSSFSLEFEAYTAMPGFTWLLGIQIQVLTCAHHSLLSTSSACNQSNCE